MNSAYNAHFAHAVTAGYGADGRRGEWANVVLSRTVALFFSAVNPHPLCYDLVSPPLDAGQDLLHHDELRGKPVLVLVNKIDMPGAASDAVLLAAIPALAGARGVTPPSTTAATATSAVSAAVTTAVPNGRDGRAFAVFRSCAFRNLGYADGEAAIDNSDSLADAAIG